MKNITALITPFNEDLSVDYATLLKLIEYQEKSNIDGLLILGTTAESFSLSLKEKIKICSLVFKNFTKKKIIAIEGNQSEKIISLIDTFKEFKPDYFLVTPPFFIKGDSLGLYKYFKRIADYSPIPIILYNIPSRAGVSLDLETVKHLANHQNIKGIKNASFDAIYNLKLSLLNNDNFLVYSGNDLNYYENLTLNNNGCFSVISNLIPNYFNNVMDAFISDKNKGAKLFKDIIPLLIKMDKEVNPLPIKKLMQKVNMIKGNLREPFSNENFEIQLSDIERRIINEYLINW